jgi:hypothetical protein
VPNVAALGRASDGGHTGNDPLETVAAKQHHDLLPQIFWQILCRPKQHSPCRRLQNNRSPKQFPLVGIDRAAGLQRLHGPVVLEYLNDIEPAQEIVWPLRLLGQRRRVGRGQPHLFRLHVELVHPLELCTLLCSTDRETHTDPYTREKYTKVSAHKHAPFHAKAPSIQHTTLPGLENFHDSKIQYNIYTLNMKMLYFIMSLNYWSRRKN